MAAVEPDLFQIPPSDIPEALQDGIDNEASRNGFTVASSGFAAMKLFQVVRAAEEMIQTHPSVLATPGPGPARSLSLSEVLCERPQLEKEFTAKWGIPKPQYRDQGSDALLRRQYKFCSKGEIGFIHSKYIISALPEEGERPIKEGRGGRRTGSTNHSEATGETAPGVQKHPFDVFGCLSPVSSIQPEEGRP